MKKLIICLLVLSLVSGLAGCGAKEVQKTEEELKAEIRAEMEAEKEAEKKAKEDGKEDEKKDKLKTFNEVYNDDLIKALDYFNDNQEKFTEDEKKAFAKSIIDEYKNISLMLLDEFMGDFPIPETAFEPMYPVLDDALYDFYDFTTNEFNLLYFETNQTHAKEFYNKMSNSEIFTIGFKIWADSGNLEPDTFVPVVKPAVFEKMKSVIQISENDIDSLEYLPNMEYEGVDSVINSKNRYPKALMHSFDEVLELKEKETWKTEIILPVKFVEKELSKQDDVFKSEDLSIGTKVSDKFEVESFKSGDMGSESISFKLKSNNFVKGELFEKDLFIYVRFDENVFDKKVLVEDVYSDSGTTEIDVNQYTFMVDKSKLLLPPEYINHILNGGTIKGDFCVKEVTYDVSPMEVGSNAIITEVKLSDFEIERLNKEINEKISDAMPDVYLKGFENETLYSEDSSFTIDYSKYSLVIVPMQESINVRSLMPRAVEVTKTGKETMLSFSVFGTLNNVKLKYTKNALDDTEQPKEIFVADKIENECVFVNAELPTDFSSIVITGYYQFGSGLEEISFALDDMRDHESYKIFTVDAYSFPDEDY